MLRGKSAIDGVTAGNLDKTVLAVTATVKQQEWSVPEFA
jgi:hypothetical protein